MERVTGELVTCRSYHVYSVVGKVTVTPLQSYTTNSFVVTSNVFVTFQIAVTSNCSGTVTQKIR
jgi:hypothetical protein